MDGGGTDALPPHPPEPPHIIALPGCGMAWEVDWLSLRRTVRPFMRL